MLSISDLAVITFGTRRGEVEAVRRHLLRPRRGRDTGHRRRGKRVRQIRHLLCAKCASYDAGGRIKAGSASFRTCQDLGAGQRA